MPIAGAPDAALERIMPSVPPTIAGPIPGQDAKPPQCSQPGPGGRSCGSSGASFRIAIDIVVHEISFVTAGQNPDLVFTKTGRSTIHRRALRVLVIGEDADDCASRNLRHECACF
jgi:hypothetical protein